jgi:hypothetical protein
MKIGCVDVTPSLWSLTKLDSYIFCMNLRVESEYEAFIK